MTLGGWRGLGLLAFGGLFLSPQGALAADLFIHTRPLSRHAGEELPQIAPLNNVLTAYPSFTYRRLGPLPYAPALTTRSDIAAAAGVFGPASIASGAVRAKAQFDDGQVTGAARSDTAHAFSDGAGNKINYGYKRDTEYLSADYGQTSNGQVSLNAVRDIFNDIKAPNYGTDTPRLEQSTIRLGAERSGLPWMFDTLKAALGYTHLYARSDNFSLRQPAASKFDYLVERPEWKAELGAVRTDGDVRTELGADISLESHDNVLYTRNLGPEKIGSYRVPGIESWQGGLSISQRRDLGALALQAGLRYDLISKSASDVHAVPDAGGTFSVSPQRLYETYYGARRDNSPVEHNVSGRVRIGAEKGLVRPWLDLKRLVRTADNGERYYAHTGPASVAQIGDPEISPEKHHIAEIGAAAADQKWKGYGLASPAGAWRIATSLAHDRVQDFITPDRARGQAGIRMSDGALVYRNVEAGLTTLSADLQYTAAPWLATRLNVTGARGRNTTDHRPLYQVAPLEANACLDAFHGDADGLWNAGLRLRLVAAKRSVDDSQTTGSGQDAGGPAGGYGTLDLYGGWRFSNHLAVSGGIENVFDKLYREHISASPQTPNTKSVNAPGRTFFLRGQVSF